MKTIKYVILPLFFILLISLSAVSANENSDNTTLILNDQNDSNIELK